MLSLKPNCLLERALGDEKQGRGLMNLLARRFFAKQWRVLAIVALVAASLMSAPQKPYSKHEKAFFLPDAQVQFVRPGLTITVNSATIGADGTITTTFSLTDPNGLGLDNLGAVTPGTISVSFVAATIPANAEQYTSYTTRTATGTVIASTQQPGADSGGTLTALGTQGQ